MDTVAGPFTSCSSALCLLFPSSYFFSLNFVFVLFSCKVTCPNFLVRKGSMLDLTYLFSVCTIPSIIFIFQIHGILFFMDDWSSSLILFQSFSSPSSVPGNSLRWPQQIKVPSVSSFLYPQHTWSSFFTWNLFFVLFMLSRSSLSLVTLPVCPHSSILVMNKVLGITIKNIYPNWKYSGLVLFCFLLLWKALTLLIYHRNVICFRDTEVVAYPFWP